MIKENVVYWYIKVSYKHQQVVDCLTYIQSSSQQKLTLFYKDYSNKQFLVIITLKFVNPLLIILL